MGIWSRSDPPSHKSSGSFLFLSYYVAEAPSDPFSQPWQASCKMALENVMSTKSANPTGKFLRHLGRRPDDHLGLSDLDL